MKLKNMLIGYFQLFRLQTAAATALTPFIGALVAGQDDIFILFILLIIGFLYHIYGFVLNEYVDIEVDKKSNDLKDKPLVSGFIPRINAFLIVILSIFFTCFLTVFFFTKILPVLFLILALFLGGIYDIFGKKIPGLDFVLGLGFFFFCLMGASTKTNDFTTLTYIVSLIYFIHISFNNSVEGGIKDVDHDYLAGAKTLATKMKVLVKNRSLIVNKKFAVFSFFLKFIFIFLIFLLSVQPEINLFNYEKNMIQLILFSFFCFIIFFTMIKFLYISEFDRLRLKKLFSLHEMSSYFLLIISISPLVETRFTFFLVLFPFIWYILFNLVLYGKPLQPRV
ncbi:MAG: UbiA family prenyltransferase [Candidatus Thermoplasmatota archaeon]|jgi:4-hydroxybenzoate polyprenyltransferase|nr:UbiA family prenyltransferase [Candidatus Thermoplasmatota archaeon]